MAESGECYESYGDYSDNYYDFVCASCMKDNKNVEAVKFCMECHHLFCPGCLEHHNKIDSLRSHQILDRTASIEARGKEKTDIPTTKCTEHDGKIIEMFCKTHDEPCCIVCASLYHSSCPDKDYLPKVAKTYMKSAECQNMITSALKVKHNLEKSKKKREVNLEGISNQRLVILSKIKEKRDAINERLDAAENELKAKLDTKLIKYSTELTEDIEQLDGFINIISGYQETIDYESESKSDNYIKMMQMKKKLADGTRFAAKLCPPSKSIHYFEGNDMLDIFKMIDNFSFGYISGSGAVESMVEEADVNIRSRDDTAVCCISDSCLMENGDIILSDQNNRNVKKLDCSLHLKEWLALPGKPCAVSPIGDSQIAVSLLNKKTIQFVSTGSPMTNLSSIHIGESCRGIAYSDGKLYLSCGGMTKFHDGPGEIRVYEKSGNFVRKVTNGVNMPKRMAMGTDKHPVDIYIADEENGVFSLDTSEHSNSVTPRFHSQELRSPVGICYIGKGQVAVCGYDSDNLLLITKSGVLIKELWSRSQGIEKPKSICLDHTGYKLLIGLTDKDHIKVGSMIRS